VFSIIAGFIGFGDLYERFFHPGGADHVANLMKRLFDPFLHAPVVAVIGLLAVGLGYAVATWLYKGVALDPLSAKLGSFARLLRNRFYLDEFYEATVIRFHEFLARVAAGIDHYLIEGFAVGLVREGTDLLGRTLRQFQTGNLQAYAVLFALGVAVVLFLALK
jgi:NADH-quinone oxidoreductase subunit L